jgi:nuclease S1
VADLAESILMQSGNYAAVKAILGDLSLSDIATCPDELRRFQRNPNVPMSAPCQQVFGASAPTGSESWHYISIPISLDTPSDSDIEKVCRNACVVDKINAYGALLAARSTSKSARLQALSFVVHFIGDVHQPLHAAVRDNDAGGNAEHVSIGGQSTVLHHAWDEELVSEIDTDPQALAQDLKVEITMAFDEPKGQPNDWTRQSFAYAKSVAYPGVPPANGTQVVATLDASYQNRAHPVIRLQIARAGVRLADFITAKTGRP